jgi:bacterioferritin-associated ferredoxin
MLVCNCNDVEYEEIKDAVKEFGADDIEKIKEETAAGTACECCLEEDCDMVDLPLPLAIKKAQEELK